MMRALAAQFLALAEKQGAIIPLVVGHRIMGSSLLLTESLYITEYLIRDRISFMRFLDLELEDLVPDATTIWLFREALAHAQPINKLFERFGQHLEAEGYIARGGQIIHATIVSVPKQRNTKE